MVLKDKIIKSHVQTSIFHLAYQLQDQIQLTSRNDGSQKFSRKDSTAAGVAQ